MMSNWIHPVCWSCCAFMWAGSKQNENTTKLKGIPFSSNTQPARGEWLLKQFSLPEGALDAGSETMLFKAKIFEMQEEEFSEKKSLEAPYLFMMTCFCFYVVDWQQVLMYPMLVWNDTCSGGCSWTSNIPVSTFQVLELYVPPWLSFANVLMC